jgi:cell shape-determining protein MreC
MDEEWASLEYEGYGSFLDDSARSAVAMCLSWGSIRNDYLPHSRTRDGWSATDHYAITAKVWLVVGARDRASEWRVVVKSRTWSRRVIWMCMALAAVGIEAMGWGQTPIHWGYAIAQPGQRLGIRFVQFTLLRPLHWVDSARHAVSRVQDLELRLSETTASVAAAQGTLAEYEALKASCAATESAQPTGPRVLTAAITAYGKPAIAGGGSIGMVAGSAVLTHGTLVGVVERVEQTWASVLLLSDPGVPPLLASTSRGVVGILRGDQRRFWLTEIPSDQQVEIGDRVTTKGQAGIAPNLLIGRVRALEVLPGVPTYRAEIEQLVAFENQHVVEVRQW